MFKPKLFIGNMTGLFYDGQVVSLICEPSTFILAWDRYVTYLQEVVGEVLGYYIKGTHGMNM